MSVGLSIVTAIIIGSVLACAGFEFEWAASQAGGSTGFARAITLAAGWAVLLLCAGVAFNRCKRLDPYERNSVLIFAAIYAAAASLTPRSYTFDTGLYHLPAILHINELGLETNLGWLHSRYGFFNLLLYGQAMAARVTGLSNLPTLNSLIFGATLTYTYEYIRKNRSLSALASCLVVGGALVIPSESTESFHSYNADFALGCIFLICTIGLLSWSNQGTADRVMLSILVLSFPLIKLSGLLLWPLLLIPPLLRRGIQARFTSKIRIWLSIYAILSMIVLGLFGYISTGYLAYPVAKTGPLRHNSIPKELAINDSALSTVSWARYAYSDQLAEIKANSQIGEWFPKWSKSLNGKRMLSYLSATAVILALSAIQRRSPEYISFVGFLFMFWIFAVFVFPPDPRFYWGPILATLWLGTDVTTIQVDSLSLMHSINARRLPLILVTSWACLLIFTCLWRESEYTPGSYPVKGAYKIHPDSRKPYIVPGQRQLVKSRQGACWDITPPCIP